jgi:hypothetical protein
MSLYETAKQDVMRRARQRAKASTFETQVQKIVDQNGQSSSKVLGQKSVAIRVKAINLSKTTFKRL